MSSISDSLRPLPTTGWPSSVCQAVNSNGGQGRFRDPMADRRGDREPAGRLSTHVLRGPTVCSDGSSRLLREERKHAKTCLPLLVR
jgi:hypothetical protein